MRAHTTECKAALMVGINEFFFNGRYIRKNSQPAKRISSFKGLDLIAWNAFSGNAMETVTPRHKITYQFLLFTILLIDNARARSVRIIILHADRWRFVVNNAAGLVNMSLHQVICDFGLTIHHYNFAIRMLGEIDSFQTAIESNIDSLMNQSF